MSLLAAITALAEAAAAWLRLKAMAYPETLHSAADDTEDEIEHLRDLGTPAATDRADRLRARLARRRGFAETLSALHPPARAEPANPDTGRPAPPAGP